MFTQQRSRTTAPPRRQRDKRRIPEGRLYQVWDRDNYLSDLLRDSRLTEQGQSLIQQIAAIIARGYQRTAVICHQPMTKHLCHLRVALGTFYETHPQAFRSCDCLVIAGTPMLPIEEIKQQAAMIYFERDRPFQAVWSTRDVSYPGQPYAIPVRGFWRDPDLQRVLEDSREAEIVRAVYRGQPINRPVDIWLLTSIPTELRVTDLLSVDDVLRVPAGRLGRGPTSYS
jgi:hypothetical protein